MARQARGKLGQYGRHFQSQDVREKLDYAEGSPEAHYMHNLIGRLKRQGIIDVAGDKERRRNRYFRIVDDATLRRRLDRTREIGTRSSSATTTSAVDAKLPEAPKRVLYLEDRVTQLEEVVAKIDPAAMTDIKDRLDALDQKVGDLVEMWS